MTEHFLFLRVTCIFLLICRPLYIFYGIHVWPIYKRNTRKPASGWVIHVILHVVNKENLNECRAYAVIVKWKKEDSDKINFSFKFVCVSLWILVDINLNVFFTFLKNIKMLSIILYYCVRICCTNLKLGKDKNT